MAEKKYKVWIDCDPGVDDAAALFIAAKMPEIEVVGVSTCAGNVEHRYTYKNARDLLQFAGLKVPVYAGAEAPVIREPHHAKEIHGATGLSGKVLPEATAAHETTYAWDALYEAAVAANGELVLIFIGPLTNLSIALQKYPDLPTIAPRLIIMGGGVKYGNTTPAAEFNIYFDPEAAAHVFKAGFNLSMLGLDVTMQAELDRNALATIQKIAGEHGQFLHDCLSVTLDFLESRGLKTVCMHDACTLLYLVYPDMFTSEMCGVFVETKGTHTYGKTVADLYSDYQYPEKNCDVVHGLDHAYFMRVFLDLLSQYAKE